MANTVFLNGEASTDVLSVGKDPEQKDVDSCKVRGFFALGKTQFPVNLTKTDAPRNKEHQLYSANVLLACSAGCSPADKLKQKYLFRGQLNGGRAFCQL